MSKLISEEIVEAVTLGDKEGFMSAFQSALAAKVSDALEIKKVEIASTLIAPASSEVVEEEVEQIDEDAEATVAKLKAKHKDHNFYVKNGKVAHTYFSPAKVKKLKQELSEEVEQIDEAADYTLKHVGTSHPKDVTDDEDQPVKATEKSYEIHKGGKKVGELEHHHNEYGGHFYSGNLHGRRFPWARNNNSLGGKNDAHSYLASALKSKWHTSKHSATNEEVEQIDELSKDTLRKYVKSAEADATNKNREATKNRLVGKRSPRHAAAQATADALDRARNKRLDKIDLARAKMAKEEVEQVDEATPPIYPVHHIPTGKRVGTFQAGKGFTPHPNSNLKPGEIPNYHAKGKEPINMGSDRKMKVEEVEEIDEAKGESRISWRSRTPEEIAKSDKRRKVKVTSAELEARARARRAEKSE